MNRRGFIVGAMAAGFVSAVKATETEPLKLRFLGTGAADWRGKDARGEWRRLTSALVDDAILIDYTGTVLDVIPEGVRPELIFYTHSHDDHYRPADALRLGVKRVYAHESWSGEARREFVAAAAKLGVPAPEVRALAFGRAVTERGIAMTCIPANHATNRKGERTAMYLVEKGAERLLYATDTGGITAEAARIAGIDAHESGGKPITALVMEATMGVGHEDDYRIFTHSSVGTVARIVRVLAKTGRYLPPSGRKVYLTHMARTLHGVQAEIAAGVPAPLCPAHDGLEVIFGGTKG